MNKYLIAGTGKQVRQKIQFRDSLSRERISIVVTVYNIESYLPRCLETISKQTYQNLEIILVDDGSKDSSSSICDEFAKKDHRAKVIHQQNAGLKHSTRKKTS